MQRRLHRFFGCCRSAGRTQRSALQKGGVARQQTPAALHLPAHVSHLSLPIPSPLSPLCCAVDPGLRFTQHAVCRGHDRGLGSSRHCRRLSRPHHLQLRGVPSFAAAAAVASAAAVAAAAAAALDAALAACGGQPAANACFVWVGSLNIWNRFIPSLGRPVPRLQGCCCCCCCAACGCACACRSAPLLSTLACRPSAAAPHPARRSPRLPLPQINLSPDKAAVLREAYRVLAPGGEMYFSGTACCPGLVVVCACAACWGTAC